MQESILQFTLNEAADSAPAQVNLQIIGNTVFKADVHIVNIVKPIAEFTTSVFACKIAETVDNEEVKVTLLNRLCSLRVDQSCRFKAADNCFGFCVFIHRVH